MSSDKPATCRIVIVDDHPAVREGLCLVLEHRGIRICGEAADRAQAMEQVDVAHPDAVVVDLSLNNESGMALIENLHARGVPVVVYSMHDDAVHIKRAFAVGANGYVTKREGTDVLVEAIREVVAGHRYLSERVRKALIDDTLDNDCTEARQMSLSGRETLVLQWVGEGDSSEEIARRLHISTRTVETYCGRIKEKLGLDGMRELRRYAIQRAHEGRD